MKLTHVYLCLICAVWTPSCAQPVPPDTTTSAPLLNEAEEDCGTPDHSDTTHDVELNCDQAPMAGPGDLLINEVLTDVPTGLDGDTNDDGARSAFDDEFVEVWNMTDALLRVEGASIRKDEDTKFNFSGCLEANSGVVVFSGINDGFPLPAFEGMQVYTSDRAFQFINTGGQTVSLFADDDDTLIDIFHFPDGDGSSFVRQPERSASGIFVHHSEVADTNFSPGTCADGSRLADGCF